MLTRTQFALAVRADEKWVENTARALGRRLAYTPGEARWLGLVRVLAQDFSLPLARAAELAEAALWESPDTRAFPVLETPDGSAALVLDLARYHSAFIAALATALHHDGPRRRGRRPAVAGHLDPLAAAEAYGVDLSLLRAGLRRPPAEHLARLDANAAFFKGVRAVSPAARRPATALVRVLANSGA